MITRHRIKKRDATATDERRKGDDDDPTEGGRIQREERKKAHTHNQLSVTKRSIIFDFA